MVLWVKWLKGRTTTLRGAHSIFRGLAGPVFLPFGPIELRDAKTFSFSSFSSRHDGFPQCRKKEATLCSRDEQSVGGGNTPIRFIRSLHRLRGIFWRLVFLGQVHHSFAIPFDSWTTLLPLSTRGRFLRGWISFFLWSFMKFDSRTLFERKHVDPSCSSRYRESVSYRIESCIWRKVDRRF